MTANPVEQLMELASEQSLFPATSRYHRVGTTTMETEDGRTIRFLKRRFVPSPEKFQTVQEHVVADGDRLDNVTAKYLGDPEQFWQICDANGAIRPTDLVKTPNSTIRITLPEGLGG